MSSNVAAIVITYNSGEHIGACLQSLRGVGEVVVVDNASMDETCNLAGQCAPQVKLISNSLNRGFAAAANQGIRATENPFVLLLNPDTVLRGGLDAIVEVLRRPEVGAVTGRLTGVSGEPQRGFHVRSFPTPATIAAEAFLLNRLWPSNPVNRRYRRLDFDFDEAQEVDQPAGAFLMIRRDVLEEVGYLDERFYPLWFEDVDLCLRIRRAGYSIRYTPACQAVHQGAHSVRALTAEQRHLAWYGNLLRFIDKHFSAGARARLRLALLAGLILRWLLCLARTGAREERLGYQGAIRLVLHRDSTRWTSLSLGNRIGTTR